MFRAEDQPRGADLARPLENRRAMGLPARRRERVPGRGPAPVAQRIARSAAGGGAGDPLGDRRWTTAWDALAPPGGEAHCAAVFQRPREVCAARLILGTEHRHFRWRLWGRGGSDEPWRPLADEQIAGRLEWSGDRPFTASRHVVLETRFPAQRLAELRVSVRQHGAEPRPRRIVELQLFEPDAPAPIERERLPDLARALAEAGVRRVYADRWTGYALEGAGFDAARGDPYVADRRDHRYDPRIGLTRDTAIVVREEDAELTVAALSQAGVPMTAQRVAPWLVFRFDLSAWRGEYAGNRSLRWAGIGCLYDAGPEAETP